MTARLEEYRLADGRWSLHRRDAILVTAGDVAAAAARALNGWPLTVRYFVATAAHESNYAVNERDTEPADDDGHRFQSWGIYQISDGEKHAVQRPAADLLSLDDATEVMMLLAMRNRAAIRVAAGLHDADADPSDLPAYLALAHNQGREAARRTILHYGLDWPAYRRRNAHARIVPYGDDCLEKGQAP